MNLVTSMTLRHPYHRIPICLKLDEWFGGCPNCKIVQKDPSAPQALEVKYVVTGETIFCVILLCAVA